MATRLSTAPNEEEKIRKLYSEIAKERYDSHTTPLMNLVGRVPDKVLYFQNVTKAGTNSVDVDNQSALMKDMKKYKEIKNLTIYFDEGFKYEEDDVENAPSVIHRGQAYLLPNTLTPKEGDYFITHTVFGSSLYRIAEVTVPESMHGKPAYTIQYEMDEENFDILTDKDYNFKNNVLESYTFHSESIGTGDRAILEDSIHENIVIIDKAIDRLVKYYKDNFFNEESNFHELIIKADQIFESQPAIITMNSPRLYNHLKLWDNAVFYDSYISKFINETGFYSLVNKYVYPTLHLEPDNRVYMQTLYGLLQKSYDRSIVYTRQVLVSLNEFTVNKRNFISTLFGKIGCSYTVPIENAITFFPFDLMDKITSLGFVENIDPTLTQELILARVIQNSIKGKLSSNKGNMNTFVKGYSKEDNLITLELLPAHQQYFIFPIIVFLLKSIRDHYTKPITE